MNLVRNLEQLMRMDEATWQRHANPWSGWTRLPILPLLALAVWARVWIGWWCLVPVVLLAGWAFWNPRAFAPPRSTDNWMSKVTFGERIWLAPETYNPPAHHKRAANLLGIVSAIGILPMAYGLWSLNVWAVILGLVLTVGGKLWLMDRMVWLYDQMHQDNEELASWLR